MDVRRAVALAPLGADARPASAARGRTLSRAREGRLDRVDVAGGPLDADLQRTGVDEAAERVLLLEMQFCLGVPARGTAVAPAQEVRVPRLNAPRLAASWSFARTAARRVLLM